MRIKSIQVLLIILALSIGKVAKAQKMDYELRSETTIFLKSISNDMTMDLGVLIDGNRVGEVKVGATLTVNRECKKFVKVESSKGTEELWRSGNTAAKWREMQKNETSQPEPKPAVEDKEVPKPQEINVAKPEPVGIWTKKVDKNDVLYAFKGELEKDKFYSVSYLDSLKAEIRKHIGVLEYVSDKEHKDRYVHEQRLNGFVVDKENQIGRAEERIEYFIEEFINSTYRDCEIIDKKECIDEMSIILKEKIKERKETVEVLRDAISDDIVASVVNKLLSGESIVVNVLVITIIVLVIVFLVVKLSKKKRGKKVDSNVYEKTTDGKADIIVRRKTTSILKKQSLEDVNNNDAYYQINCNEFCNDSAVRRIYIKNTCIKDIYNMYAEDLRNPENPKEDGCMVLGRWVHDNDNDEYYVSLEDVVKPGDDAVFKEYELNFGGKIKLKVAERLRKLRRETNLQYDMTCWVHSHPGLGVFFSNADSGVQMQLKHPTHPNFLVAIVVDILTPNQEMGIFTFKHDQTINSKADLTKMYSLEELYKWAIESDRNSFKADDYFNLLQSSQSHYENLYGIELSNSAIIDMSQMETELQPGSILWAHGYVSVNNGMNVYIINSISKSRQIQDNELQGCMVVGTHCSIPTIRKVIANNLDDMNFVLFYSISDGIITSIPIINNQISVDEKYYGEEKLDNLKIWTRRKR